MLKIYNSLSTFVKIYSLTICVYRIKNSPAILPLSKAFLSFMEGKGKRERNKSGRAALGQTEGCAPVFVSKNVRFGFFFLPYRAGEDLQPFARRQRGMVDKSMFSLIHASITSGINLLCNSGYSFPHPPVSGRRRPPAFATRPLRNSR